MKKKAEAQSKSRPTSRSKDMFGFKKIVCFLVISVTFLLKKKKPMDRRKDVWEVRALTMKNKLLENVKQRKDK